MSERLTERSTAYVKIGSWRNEQKLLDGILFLSWVIRLLLFGFLTGWRMISWLGDKTYRLLRVNYIIERNRNTKHFIHYTHLTRWNLHRSKSNRWVILVMFFKPTYYLMYINKACGRSSFRKIRDRQSAPFTKIDSSAARTIIRFGVLGEFRGV